MVKYNFTIGLYVLFGIERGGCYPSSLSPHLSIGMLFALRAFMNACIRCCSNASILTG